MVAVIDPPVQGKQISCHHPQLTRLPKAASTDTQTVGDTLQLHLIVCSREVLLCEFVLPHTGVSPQYTHAYTDCAELLCSNTIPEMRIRNASGQWG